MGVGVLVVAAVVVVGAVVVGVCGAIRVTLLIMVMVASR